VEVASHSVVDESLLFTDAEVVASSLVLEDGLFVPLSLEGIETTDSRLLGLLGCSQVLVKQRVA